MSVPPPQRPAEDRVVVHATLRSLVAAAVAPSSLLAIGGTALARGGLAVPPLLLTVLGVVLTVVVLFDVPRRAELDEQGITRVCPLRRHHLRWEELIAIERSRPASVTIARNAIDRREGHPPRVSGGLVARGHGRRRWLLTDAVESRAEHDRIRSLLDDLPVPVVLRAPAPHVSAPPTGLYRRR